MAVTFTSRETYTCSRDGCEETFQEGRAVDGSYCSEQCATRVAGENLLKHIKRDHRFCHGCFRQLKEIERPPSDRTLVVGPVDHDAVADTWRNCLVGFEHLTEHAELGERGRDYHHDETETRGPDAVVSGTVCVCGTTDHQDPYLRLERVTSIPTAARRLCEIIGLLGAEGQHDKALDVGDLLDELEREAEDDEELDWARATGEAIR